MFAGRDDQPFDIERCAFEPAGQGAEQLIIEYGDLHQLVSRLQEFVIDHSFQGSGASSNSRTAPKLKTHR